MAVGRQREASIDPFPAVCYEVDPKDLEGSHVPRISSQRSTSPPMRLFLPDSRCLPATEIYPFKWHVPTNSRSSRLESLACNFENSSHQTRVKKKGKKKGFSPSREREPVRRIIHTGMEDFCSAVDSRRISFSSMG